VRPALGLCKATGVVLGAGSRVLVMADRGGVAQQLVGRLQALGAQALVVDDAPSAEALTERLRAWLADGPVEGLYWLPALDREPEIEALDLTGWREALRVRVKLLHATVRALDAGMDEVGRFVVVATRLGGRHGYDDGGAVAAMGGAVTGFAKAYRRERAALVKAVDVAAAAEPAAVADVLVAETLTDPGTVEVGHADGLRWTVGLVAAPAADGRPGMLLGPDGVFVVTGAAGGIVSAIIADLAAASGGTFHLLDRIPEPDAGDPDLARFASSREELKRELVDRLRARGERATPALVERQLAALERAQAALAAMHAVREAGGEAHYHAVDLTDATAVAAVVDDVQRRHGRIDVLVHAAGVEVSHLLAEKVPAEFDLVFDVKCDGWFNLMHAVGDMPLAAIVAFSSIAGRFGNRGQTDYSAANDLLCKMTSHLAAARPSTRALAIDWTAWAGIGMASRGSIPTMMAQAGIDMLPAAAGVPVVRRELVAGGAHGEVVIADRLGVLLEEWDPSGGLDPARAESATQASGPMIGRVTGVGVDGWLRIETSLDPRVQPFLADHRIDGTAVLPGVMGMEAFAEAATLLVPGWHVVSVEDVTFHAPFKFYRDEPRTLQVEVLLRAAGEELLAACRLIGTRQLTGQDAARETVHFTGRVRLARRAPKTTALPRPAPPNGAGVGAEDIYRLYFHGPAYRVLESSWRDGDSTVGLMAEGLGPNHVPAAQPTLVAPRLIELCFQTVGVAELAHTGHLALPERVAELRVFPCPEEGQGRLHAVVTHSPEGGSDAHVVDAAGNVHVTLRGYRTVALPEPARADELQSLQGAVG
jgi:NAD(P)-dependent dehydrogenase (short-subunit alcohol dehydrogenase family)